MRLDALEPLLYKKPRRFFMEYLGVGLVVLAALLVVGRYYWRYKQIAAIRRAYTDKV